jgi:hypothetical protein
MVDLKQYTSISGFIFQDRSNFGFDATRFARGRGIKRGGVAGECRSAAEEVGESKGREITVLGVVLGCTYICNRAFPVSPRIASLRLSVVSSCMVVSLVLKGWVCGSNHSSRPRPPPQNVRKLRYVIWPK